jgi:lysophospholipase L1-like esterase
MIVQRTVLCYGDSNTWGYVPSKNVGIGRYSRNDRWPGVLQDLLGKNYYVVEEGLNGRTTNLDYHIPPNRNGKTYLLPCLYTHAPIDLVVIALGGNDLKVYFDRTPDDIRDGVAELIDVVQASKYGQHMQASPEVLIVTSPIPLIVAEQYVDEDGIVVFEGAIEKAKSLIGLYAELSEEKQCHFLDISKTIFPSSIDGLHFDEIAHKNLAQVMCKKITDIFLN